MATEALRGQQIEVGRQLNNPTLLRVPMRLPLQCRRIQSAVGGAAGERDPQPQTGCDDPLRARDLQASGIAGEIISTL
ncbi:MAG: hypothetical protein CM1200mP27_11610 [Chloroflexota bacterium]|nr:MAG: hypothetical protein CM1200mP27_11610 [Chloroflexota bacterium]